MKITESQLRKIIAEEIREAAEMQQYNVLTPEKAFDILDSMAPVEAEIQLSVEDLKKLGITSKVLKGVNQLVTERGVSYIQPNFDGTVTLYNPMSQ